MTGKKGKARKDAIEFLKALRANPKDLEIYSEKPEGDKDA